MKTGKMLVFVLMTLLSCQSVFAQGFQPPAEGKAVVYFICATPNLASFEYFHNDKYIGTFKGKNYMRYECEPGKHLFWASSENKEFIEADLAGGTYIVMVSIETGAMKARVGLNPITSKNTEEFIKALGIVKDKELTVSSPKQVDKMNERLKDFITEKLKMYNDVWKKKYNYPIISPDMAIQKELLK
jgi:hypothetical protein